MSALRRGGGHVKGAKLPPLASESVALNFAGQKPDSGSDGENLVRVTERMEKFFRYSCEVCKTALAACSTS